MKIFKRITSTAMAVAISLTAFAGLQLQKQSVLLKATAADFSYPVQEFRMGISDTDCNINISGTADGDYLNGWTINGTDNEKWYLNFISDGIYEIVSSATGYVVTNDNGLAVIAPDKDAANQRWQISCVEQDFEGYDLYYKIVSNADVSQALTYDINSNSIQVYDYTGDSYQKFRLNLDGLEGYAANCSIGGKMKAGTIGGLLGETVFADTNQELIDALNSTKPMTVVLTADLDLAAWNKDNQRIRDNKTLIGSYANNTIYDSQLRNDDFWGKDAAPSNNIVIRNMNLVARTLNSSGSGVILLQFYGVRNLWVDHCDFSATFGQNKDQEVGKFIWINTPSESWSDGVYNGINPDYITISYNYFKNRYWTVAYGSQNKDTSRLRTTMMFNKWEQCSRRCPQYSNGYHHNYSSYHTVTDGSNPNASSQVIGGEGSRILSENNRFEAYSGKDFDIDKTSNLSFHDYNSYTSSTVGGTPSVCSTTARGTAWNAYDSYGYCLVDGYSANGKDTKTFCNTYSGCFDSADKIKYITDSELSDYISQRYYDPFLREIKVGDDPVYGKQGAVINTTYDYTIKNVNSGLYLEVKDGIAADGTDVQQGSSKANVWSFVDAGDGYYNIVSENGYFLNVESGLTDNGTNIEIWSGADTDSQLFKFVPNEDGSYTITTKVSHDRSALGVVMGSKDEGMTVVEWECNGSDDQKWIVDVKLKDGAVMDTSKTYTFCNVNSGLYLEPANSAVADSVDVQQGNSKENGWHLEDAGEGYYKIFTETDGTKRYILNVFCGYTENGTNIELFTDVDAESQLFKFVLNDDGSYTITTKVTKDLSALGVAMGSTEEGATVVQWECNGSDDQKWNIEVKSERIKGDVNSDGIFSAADVVMLQKWLICSPDAALTCWENADLCADNIINVFDLCAMKRELLKQYQ